MSDDLRKRLQPNGVTTWCWMAASYFITQ